MTTALHVDEETREAFRTDGAVLLKDCLDESQLARCYEAFRWDIDNPGPFVFRGLDGTKLETQIDNANPRAKETLDELVTTLPFADIFADLWGSEHVWYFAEEVFLKEDGKSGRGPWHQDTANLPWAGNHWGNAWITFQEIPAKNSLEIIRGSWRGIQYDGASFADPDDPTDPLYGDGTYPRLPDIDRELAQDPDAYDVLSWAITPGDVVALHPRSLHGGAGVDADSPDRHTLVLRFFGDDATFRALPERNSLNRKNSTLTLFAEEMAELSEGDSFRSPVFKQLR